MIEYHDLANYDLPILDCYERDYYIFSNFSAFQLYWKGKIYPTSEHAYHSEKFDDPKIKNMIRKMPSAHACFKWAEENKNIRRVDWDEVKLDIMKEILKEKANQHPYVMKKLKASGDNAIVECSWRDNFWGWGPNKDGQNQLGKLWMEIRKELFSVNPTKDST